MKTNRRRRRGGATDNLDSLLDTMANAVGILIVLLAVTQISVSDAVARLRSELESRPELSQESFHAAAPQNCWGSPPAGSDRTIVASQSPASHSRNFRCRSSSADFCSSVAAYNMIAANRVGVSGTGFGSDNNVLSIYWAGGAEELEVAPKTQLARQLIRIVADRYREKHPAQDT